MAFKSLADPSFEYRSAANTDVRITFERVRREMEEARRRETEARALSEGSSMQAATPAGAAPH